MIVLYVFMALVSHIYKNSGSNGTPECQKLPNLLHDAILTSWCLARFSCESLKLIAFLVQKLGILPQNSQFGLFLLILDKSMQICDVLSAIAFHQIVVATFLTSFWKA